MLVITGTVMDISDSFTKDIMRSARDALSIVGAPIRTVLLSDLLLPNVSWDSYRLFVFTNAYVVGPALRAALERHCRRPGVTLMWQYSAGLYATANGSSTPSVDAMRDLVGLPLVRGPGSLHLRTVGAGYDQYPGPGHDPPVDPWYYLNVTTASSVGAVDVLGRLVEAPSETKSAGLVRVSHPQGHTTIFSAAPGLPAPLWRTLTSVAGVHLFTDCIGDAVEVHGDLLTLHASASCGVGVRTVALPINAMVVDEAGSIVCSACARFDSHVLQPGDHVLYSIKQRLGERTSQRRNSEHRSGGSADDGLLL